MSSLISSLIILGSLAWPCILLLPWKPWSTREQLDCDDSSLESDVPDVTVLIPARDEAESISRTVAALEGQGKNLAVIVIDDQSVIGAASDQCGKGGRMVLNRPSGSKDAQPLRTGAIASNQ